MLRDHSLSPFRRVAWDVFLSYRQRSERELAEGDALGRLHHGALAVSLVQSIHRQLEGFHFVCVYSHVFLVLSEGI